ncbi:hypothetical protein FHX36_002933 [Modestobacter versicolor]|uniref:Uncharacterized protein n=1 Tax=Modestobacter versicolor TaxID=429133 RepID=A0A839Y1V0_9ACTN|nr:hypothetical protein [Modestobacter versicolor]
MSVLLVLTASALLLFVVFPAVDDHVEWWSPTF